LTATFLAISDDRKILQNPSLLETQTARSIHVLAFTSHAEPLVIESQGSFTPAQWDEVCIQAEKICCGSTADPDAMVDEGDGGGMMQFVQTVVEEKVDKDMAWRT
jgi:exosome complex component RRP46